MDVGKINPFNMAAMQTAKPIKPTTEVAGKVAQGIDGGKQGFAAATKSNSLFAKSTSGINEAMNGQSMSTMAMAGKDHGIAGKQLNLIG